MTRREPNRDSFAFKLGRVIGMLAVAVAFVFLVRILLALIGVW